MSVNKNIIPNARGLVKKFGRLVAIDKVSRQHDAVLFQPKKLIDRDINEALADVEADRVLGPFNDAQMALTALKNHKS